MKDLKKFLCGVVLCVTLLPSAVFAYPGREEEGKFMDWFVKFCSEQKFSGEEADKYSKMFDYTWGQVASLFRSMFYVRGGSK